ncbi:MAG: SRPBCC family protein [Candidatus Methanoperedens sp.]|nr:SRPBCC family protein [Candidatus Methanoperedens sp.]
MNENLADSEKRIINIENTSREDIWSLIRLRTKEYYSHNDIFGKFCNVNQYIDVPVDFAYAYLSNIKNLEEWTFSVRSLKHIGEGLYEGVETIVENTKIYIRADCYPESKVIDWPCAWDQKEALWMFYATRLLNARPALGKDGTILIWTNFRHQNYINGPRPELIEGWNYMHVIHGIEANNLGIILENKYRKEE